MAVIRSTMSRLGCVTFLIKRPKRTSILQVTFTGAALCLLFALVGNTYAAEPVTMEDFTRAETHRYMKRFVDGGGFGKIRHVRGATPIESQTVIRMNRDTLYSSGVFDLNSPVTIIKPDSGDRFQSMQVINESHYTKLIAHDAGEYKLTKEMVGTRYVCVLFRTLIDPTDADDVKAANAIQDGIAARQESIGVFEVPDWDQQQLTQLRNRLNRIAALGEAGSVGVPKFGDVGEVNPIVRRVATAYGWGGSPREAAIYERGAPEEDNTGKPHTMTLRDVPVDGFWSVTVYNAEGYFDKNKYDAYAISDRNAKKNTDGSVTVHFGGDPSQANFLPIAKGWNYVLRLFRPRQEVLDGDWEFPAIEPVTGRTGT